MGRSKIKSPADLASWVGLCEVLIELKIAWGTTAHNPAHLFSGVTILRCYCLSSPCDEKYRPARDGTMCGPAFHSSRFIQAAPVCSFWL